jgi:integrase
MNSVKEKMRAPEFSLSGAPLPSTGKAVAIETAQRACAVPHRVGSAAVRNVEERTKAPTIPCKCRPTFASVAADWVERELLHPIVVKPKAHTTLYCYQHITNDYLVPRWGDCIAEQIDPCEVENWLAGLSIDSKGERGLEWDTLSKIRSVMKQIYAHAQRIKLIPKSQESNPFRPADQGGVRCKTGTTFRPIILTPQQTLAMLRSLPPLERMQVILDASTGLRASEIAGLQWHDVDWDNQLIDIRRTWIKGRIGKPKSPDSEAPMPMSPVLAAFLRDWRKTTRYARPTDWVFASKKTKGRTPRVGNMIVADYLYPAAVKAGVLTVQKTTARNKKGEKVVKLAYFDRKGKLVTRFGFHNFRHSLSSFLTTKKKTDPKTAQRMLRQSDPTLTLRRYTQTDMDELLAAQGMVLEAILGPPDKPQNSANTQRDSEAISR